MTRDEAGGPPVGRALRIGLTGPIGCGKTTVAGWLAARGAQVVDADGLAHRATAPGEPALEAVIARFGEAFRRPDGSLDRAALGRLVFSDPSALGDLEAIVHPAVRRLIVAALAQAEEAGAPAVVLEAIKLVESGLAAVCDEVWVVTCRPQDQRERLRSRGWPVGDAEQRIAAQGDLAARLQPVATRLIRTDGPPEAAERAVAAAYEKALAAHTAGARTAPDPDLDPAQAGVRRSDDGAGPADREARRVSGAEMESPPPPSAGIAGRRPRRDAQRG